MVGDVRRVVDRFLNTTLISIELTKVHETNRNDPSRPKQRINGYIYRDHAEALDCLGRYYAKCGELEAPNKFQYLRDIGLNKLFTVEDGVLKKQRENDGQE